MSSSLRLAAVAACVGLFLACSGDAADVVPRGEGDDGGASDASTSSGDAGSSSDGDAGDAGDAGVVPDCDDGNPCTEDRLEDAGCVHVTRPDGTVCSDGLRCTGDDRCQAGVCRGIDLAPSVVSRGTFFGYGAPPNEDGPALVGLADLVSDTHVLFAETLGIQQLGVSLVEVTANGLERLDTKVVDVPLARYFHGRDWSEILATFFVPLGPDRTVLVGSRRRLELFDTSSGKIESLATFPLHPVSDSIIAGAGRGSRFYTCSLHELITWEIDAAGEIQRLGAVLPAHDCRSLSLSADGNELLVASSQGIDRVDVSNPSAPVFGDGFASARAFGRVDANGDLIVGQRQGLYGAMGDIEVYRRSDLAVTPAAPPVAIFASTGALPVPSALPIGFALLDDAIAVEWRRGDGTHTSYTTEVYALPGTGAPLRTFVHRRVRDERLSLTATPLVRRGRHLVVPPWRTVLRDDPATGVLTPLTGPEQAGFEVVTPLAANRLTAFSGRAKHEIDLLDPTAPAVTSTTLPVDVGFLRWEPNGRDPLSAPGGFPPVSLAARQRPTPVSCFTRASSGALGSAGAVTLPARGNLADLGHAMLEVEPKNEPGQFRVQWFDAPAACDGRTLAAKVDGTIQLHPGDNRSRTSWAFDGDRSGAPSILLAELRRAGDDPFGATFAWLEPASSGTGWQIAAQSNLEGALWFALALRVHGDRAVLTDGRKVFVLRRTGKHIEIVASRELEHLGELEEIVSILRFDGELVYLASRQPTTGVVVLRVPDLEPLARFETHGVVKSMAEVGDRLVLGSANAIDVADVVCPR